jgi:signal transduction histidine kinase
MMRRNEIDFLSHRKLEDPMRNNSSKRAKMGSSGTVRGSKSLNGNGPDFELKLRQMAHDLRSPLSALNLLISGMNHQENEQASLMKQSIERLNSIAREILRPSSTRASIERLKLVGECQNQTISGNDMLQIISQVIQEKILDTNMAERIEFKAFDCRINGLRVRGEYQQLARILSNLIDNAVESYEGGPGRVVIAAQVVGGNLEVSVIDAGKGIPQSIIPQLGREPLSYGKSMGKNESGNGLGLYHACSTLKQFGGDLQINSSVGRGSLVKILLQGISRIETSPDTANQNQAEIPLLKQLNLSFKPI